MALGQRFTARPLSQNGSLMDEDAMRAGASNEVVGTVMALHADNVNNEVVGMVMALHADNGREVAPQKRASIVELKLALHTCAAKLPLPDSM